MNFTPAPHMRSSLFLHISISEEYFIACCTEWQYLLYPMAVFAIPDGSVCMHTLCSVFLAAIMNKPHYECGLSGDAAECA